MDPHYDDGGLDGGDGDENFPGGGTNDHQFTEQRTVSAHRAETTSLALAKPENKENNIQSEVSRIFTPLEIVLYINGLDNSQVVWLPWARVMVTAAPRIQRGGPTPHPSSWSVEEPNRKVC